MAKARSYLDKDLKILLGRSANCCAFEGCRVTCMTEEQSRDQITLIGDVAHIHAKNALGPRFNPGLSTRECDLYDNLIWLCGPHHKIIDNKANEGVYPAELLLQWKKDLEAWVAGQLSSMNVPAEVETLLNLLVNEFPSSGVYSDFHLLPVAEKLDFNAFSEILRLEIGASLVQCPQVGRFVGGMDALQVGWSSRLVTVFRQRYDEFEGKGLLPDEIYYRLREFASKGRRDLSHLAAGGQIIGYLFERCEIFKK
jgi:hypothetical protein